MNVYLVLNRETIAAFDASSISPQMLTALRRVEAWLRNVSVDQIDVRYETPATEEFVALRELVQ